jgi:hypothetical protein
MEGMIGRVEAVDLEAHVWRGDRVEQSLKALHVRRLFDGMDEAWYLIRLGYPLSSGFSAKAREREKPA